METLVTYLVRHGEADCNINIKQNDNDMLSPLTNKGTMQSILTGEWFKSNNIDLDKIYVSEMTRSIQTAKLINIDKPIFTSKLLNERNLGDIKMKMDGNKLMSISKQFGLNPNNYLSWSANNGESQLEVINRVKYFLEENPIKNSLIVTHGYVIYALRSIFLGINESSSYLKFVSLKGNYVRNCQIYKLIFNLNLRLIKEESFYLSENQWINYDQSTFN